MKHITTQYGQECNYIECTWDEYCILDKFLRQLGVEIRHMISDSTTVQVQARNNYKDNAEMYRNHKIGSLICELSEEEIKSGHWRR